MKRPLVVVLQNTIAPYRIPLFERLSKQTEVDFLLCLMAEERPNYPQWAALRNELPFAHILVPGFRIRTGVQSQICFNPILLRELIARRPDVIVTNGFPLNAVFVLLYKIFFGCKLIVWSESTAVSERHLVFAAVRELFRRVIARGANAFIDAGTLSRRYLVALLRGRAAAARFFTAYNAIDATSFEGACERFRSSGAEIAAFARRFPRYNILFAGQLVPLKNIEGLLAVYERVLAKSSEPIGLIVLGQGPLRAYLEDAKRGKNLKHLFIEGFIGPESYHKYFAVADVFILLSFYDRNPLVIFEALSTGLPVVCTERAGNAVDFIQEPENGFIVHPEDYDRAAEGIRFILADPARKEAMGRVSRKIAHKANVEDASRSFMDAIRFALGTR